MHLRQSRIGFVIADFVNGADNLRYVHMRRGGDFSHHEYEIGARRAFASHARVCILREDRVQYRIRNAVANLIGVSSTDSDVKSLVAI